MKAEGGILVVCSLRAVGGCISRNRSDALVVHRRCGPCRVGGPRHRGVYWSQDCPVAG